MMMKRVVIKVLRIAVCDDIQEELQRIVALTREYLIQHNLSAEVRKFSHPDELLTVCEKETFHLYLLDIVMPMVNGIDVGREIRRLDSYAQIIYATTEPGFALEAYAASPVNYLLKPLQQESFFKTMEFAISRLNLTDEKTIAVKMSGGYRTLRLCDIVCCEYIRHCIEYTLQGGETITSVSFRGDFAAHLAPLLASSTFLQCHAAFAVHVSAIRRLTRTEIELSVGRTIPVARSRYDAVKEAYLNYRLGGETRD
ncbi:LytTR family two component transcriptional regulator [Anaerobacterium chartisolvens]|uniref:Stage 0 sporulation protein A homolog n=1 Tax=Anaerobacterium chartisolvens TaxID=1297424 RepID=A0A369BFV1_9FIRM|nr:LytTR family DNA-binding domain-containing protein [Anaerobacterium chartisolvens]RCX19446.1 LytTR family two component transcriptional regulator [Anaerobacterium chartisolvens]